MIKPLIILDLDETLIHTSETFVLDHDFKIIFTDIVYTSRIRPYTKEFLEYCFDKFEVGVWTAAGKDYALQVLEHLNINKEKLKLFYTQENCTIKLSYEENRYYGLKNLNKLKKKSWAKPWKTLENVIIVDDVKSTAELNRSNLIHINPFWGDKNDKELLKLISYLKTIENATNFRRIQKDNWNKTIVL